MGQMMQDMDQDMRGMRSMMSVNMGGGGTGSRQSISMSMGGGGGGSYSCQTFVSSTRVGPDGRQHQETYSSSSHGGNNSGNRVTETQQSYRNSSTGVEKLAVERTLNDQGRKVVKERNSMTGEEHSQNLLRNLREDDGGQFETQWQSHAQRTLPNQDPSAWDPRRQHPSGWLVGA